MLGEKGQSQMILATIIIGLVVVVGLYVVIPKVSGESGPAIPGITEKNTKVTLQVRVYSPTTQWDDMSVEIKDESVRTKTFNELMTLGPLWLERDFRAQCVVRIIKDDSIIDDKPRDVKITEDWWDLTEYEDFTFEWLDVPDPGSGQYTIEAVLYDDQGDAIDKDSITRSI